MEQSQFEDQTNVNGTLPHIPNGKVLSNKNGRPLVNLLLLVLTITKGTITGS